MERPLIVYMIDDHDKVFSQKDQETYTFNNFRNTYDPMILDIIHDKNVTLPMLSSIVFDKKDSPISIDSIALIMNEYIIAQEIHEIFNKNITTFLHCDLEKEIHYDKYCSSKR